MENYDRAQLKREVREAIRGTRPRPMWITLLYTLIVAAGSWVLSLVVQTLTGTSRLTSQMATTLASLLEMGYVPEDALSELLLSFGSQLGTLIAVMLVSSLLLSILSALWSGLMGVGYKNYCRHMTRLEKPTVGTLFSGFPLIGKVVLTRFLVWVFTALWMLLFGLCFAVVAVLAALLMQASEALGVILMLLGYIAFVVMSVRVNLRYAMADYALLDEGVYGLDALTASKTMMKGNKGRLFVLYLSFFGWYLLIAAIALAAGIICSLLVAGGAFAIIGGQGSYGALAGLVGGAAVIAVAALVGIWLLSSWLQPYTTGSEAKFYDLLKGARPAPDSAGSEC